jgi:molecular chaperone GrpE
MQGSNGLAREHDGREKYRIRRRRFWPGGGEAAVRGGFPSPEKFLTGPAGAGKSEALRLAQSELAQLRADFDSFRKRVQREREELRKFAVQGFVEALIPVLDSFDQAAAALESTHDAKALTQGFQAIRRQLETVLRGQGFEKLDAAPGQAFDPSFHEALAVVAANGAPQNAIMDVIQSGYLLNGRLIRPVRVRISGKPEGRQVHAS